MGKKRRQKLREKSEREKRQRKEEKKNKKAERASSDAKGGILILLHAPNKTSFYGNWKFLAVTGARDK